MDSGGRLCPLPFGVPRSRHHERENDDVFRGPDDVHLRIQITSAMNLGKEDLVDLHPTIRAGNGPEQTLIDSIP